MCPCSEVVPTPPGKLRAQLATSVTTKITSNTLTLFLTEITK